MTQLLLFNVTNGLIIGAFYALMALGLSLILNLSNVINFAHGGFLVIGGYLAYTITPYVGFWGALLIAPALTAVIGFAVERVLIRPLYGRDPLYSLLLTFGLAFIIEDGTRFIWGAQGMPVTIPHCARRSRSAASCSSSPGIALFMVAMVVVAVAAVFALLRYTRLGMRIRAGTLDLETVAALGVNVRMLRTLNFAVGIYSRRAAGVLAAGQLGLEPTMGDRPAHAELHRHHRRRRRQPDGHAARRPADRRRLRRDGGVLCPSASEAVMYVHDGGGAAGAAARPARRGRHDDMTARCSTREAGHASSGDLGAAGAGAVLDAAARRLHRARHARAGAGARRHVGQFPARLHRRAVVRPRRLFRPRRLRRRPGPEISRCQHAARRLLSACCSAALVGAALGMAHRAPARRLFRDGDDRLRAGVLLHRLPVELGDRRRRRLARLLAPADRLRPVQARHRARTPKRSTISCSSASLLSWRSWASSCARRSGAP